MEIKTNGWLRRTADKKNGARTFLSAYGGSRPTDGYAGQRMFWQGVREGNLNRDRYRNRNRDRYRNRKITKRPDTWKVRREARQPTTRNLQPSIRNLQSATRNEKPETGMICFRFRTRSRFRFRLKQSATRNEEPETRNRPRRGSYSKRSGLRMIVGNHQRNKKPFARRHRYSRGSLPNGRCRSWTLCQPLPAGRGRSVVAPNGRCRSGFQNSI